MINIKKLIAVLCFVSCLIMIMSRLNSHIDTIELEESLYTVLEPEAVGIEIIPDMEKNMSYYVVNNTDSNLECSYWRELEICYDGKWYYFENNITWLLSSERIAPGETKYMEDEWILNYCSLREGKYRIILNMYLGEIGNGDVFSDSEKSFYLAHEFTVK